MLIIVVNVLIILKIFTVLRTFKKEHIKFIKYFMRTEEVH